MRVTIKTNDDDWCELYSDTQFTLESEIVGGGSTTSVMEGYAGHDIPEFIWIALLRAAGVTVNVSFDSFD